MKLDLKADNPTLLALIGAVFGVLVFFAGSDLPWLALFFAMTAGLFFLTCRTNAEDVLHPFAFAAAFAAYLAVCGWLGGAEQDYGVFRYSGFDSKLFYALFLLVIAVPFFMAYIEKGYPNADYRLLHQYAWDRPFLFGGAWLFVGILWAILGIWMALFNAIGIPVFDDVFSNAFFVAGSIGGGYALGVTILMRQERIIGAMRHLAETLFAVLAPVLTALVVVFLLVLPATGIAVVWDIGHTSGYIAAIVMLAITMINAIIRDGGQGASNSGLMRLCARVLALTLPVMAFIALMAIQMRISQYGLTPRRIDGAILMTVAMLYACTYAWTAASLWAQDWEAGLRRVNVTNALIVFALCALMLTPIVDLERISVWQQKRALLSGRISPDDFDFGALKFKLGPAGLEALEDIRKAAPGHKESAKLLEALKEVDAAKSHYDWDGRFRPGKQPVVRTSDLASAIDVFPKGAAVPDGFWDWFANSENGEARRCIEHIANKEDRCRILLADVMGDTTYEIFLFRKDEYEVSGFERGTKRDWQRINVYTRDYITPDELWKKSRATLDAGNVQVVPTDYKMIRFGDTILEVMPTRERE